jgi:translation initiation factor IF-1
MYCDQKIDTTDYIISLHNIITTYTMVKNTSGGTKTKGLARKHQGGAGGGGGGGALRLPKNELEQLVVVTKMLGNGMCEVFNNDDQRFIAHIRNKFKGRNRRSNDILVNSFILIGLREWEKPALNADVMFVYDVNDYHAFHSIPNLHSHKLFARANGGSGDDHHQQPDPFHHTDSIDFVHSLNLHSLTNSCTNSLHLDDS